MRLHHSCQSSLPSSSLILSPLSAGYYDPCIWRGKWVLSASSAQEHTDRRNNGAAHLHSRPRPPLTLSLATTSRQYTSSTSNNEFFWITGRGEDKYQAYTVRPLSSRQLNLAERRLTRKQTRKRQFPAGSRWYDFSPSCLNTIASRHTRMESTGADL